MTLLSPQGAARRLIPQRLLALALRALSVLVVIGCGLSLGRVLVSTEWTEAVTVIGLGAALLLLIARPKAGLFLWIVLAPYAPFLYLKTTLGSGIPDFDLTRLAVVVTLAQLMRQVVRRLRIGARGQGALARFGWPELTMLVFLVGIGFSAPASWQGPVLAIQIIFDYVFTPFFLYYLARNWLRGERDFGTAIGVLALVGTSLGIISAREQFTGAPLFSPVPYQWFYEFNLRRVLSLFGAPAMMSAVLVAPVPLLIYGVSRVREPSRRLMLALGLLVTLLGVFLCYVRGGWLGAALGIITMGVCSRTVRRRMLLFLPVVALISVVLVGTAVINPTILQGRLTSDQPIEYRLKALDIAGQIIKSAPILGVGYDNYGRVANQFGWNPVYYQIRGEVPAPHNSYIFVAASGGLLALIPYVAIFVALAWRGRYFWRRGIGRDLVAVLWATLLAYVTILGTFDVINAQYTNMLVFLIFGAVVGRLEEIERQVLT